MTIATSSTLVGGKGGAGPSPFHNTLEGTNGVCECKMDVKFTFLGSELLFTI